MPRTRDKDGRSPAFQVYAKDWLSNDNVQRMDAEQRGWFWTLLLHSWANGNPQATLPDDEEYLKEIAGYEEPPPPALTEEQIKALSTAATNAIKKIIEQHLQTLELVTDDENVMRAVASIRESLVLVQYHMVLSELEKVPYATLPYGTPGNRVPYGTKWKRVMERFSKYKKLIFNKRLMNEWVKQKEYSASRSEIGRRGGYRKHKDYAIKDIREGIDLEQRKSKLLQNLLDTAPEENDDEKVNMENFSDEYHMLHNHMGTSSLSTLSDSETLLSTPSVVGEKIEKMDRNDYGREVQEGGDKVPRGTRLKPDFQPSRTVLEFHEMFCPDVDETHARAEFIDHWTAIPGATGRKLDWQATYRNRLRALQKWASEKKQARAGNKRGMNAADELLRNDDKVAKQRSQPSLLED